MNAPTTKHQFEGTRLRATGEVPREGGTLTVRENQVEFSAPTSSLRLPVAGLLVARGGANNRLIYLKHPSYPNDTLFTLDAGILSVLRGFKDPLLTSQIRTAERQGRRVVFGIIGGCGALALLIAALLWAKDPIAGFIAHRIPIEWESKAGELIAPAMTTGAVTSPEVHAALDRFAAPLVETVKKSGFSPRFFIVPNVDLNAFALPGGTVVIFSAVIERAESGEEVLGVLAHELAHVTERHVMKNIVTSVGLYALFSFFVGDAVGGIAAIANTAPLLLSKSYSRDLERHADEVGLSYLLTAGINPRGMARFFERVLAEEERTTEAVGTIPGAPEGLRFLSTHPETTERIAALRARIEVLPPQSYRNVEIDFAALRGALKASPPAPASSSPPTRDAQSTQHSP